MTVFLGFPREIVLIFLGAEDGRGAGIVALGVTLLSFAALFQAVDAAQVMALGFLRGLQDTRWPMVLATFAYWGIGMPTGLALGFGAGLGPAGIWMGLVAGLSVAAASLTVRFWRLAAPVGLAAA